MFLFTKAFGQNTSLGSSNSFRREITGGKWVRGGGGGGFTGRFLL